MFKGFQSKSRQFNGFPNLNFQLNNEAYGFGGCNFWIDASYGLNTQTDLAAVSSWQSKIGNTTFIQATAANQPRFVLSAAAYNNNSIVQGISNARWLISNDNVSNYQTIAFVANYDVLNFNNAVVGLSTSATTSIGMGGSQTGVTGVYVRSSENNITGTTENTNPKICVITTSGLWVNNVSEYTGSIKLINFSQLMSAGSGTTVSLIGSIAEVLTYRNDLSNFVSDLSNRLNAKYAIY